MATETLSISAESAGKTLAALLRHWLTGKSWNDVRRLVESRRVRLNGEVWLDPARRLKEGDVVEVLSRAEPRRRLNIPIRYLDEHIIVVEKPSGIATVRHPAERDWNARRKALTPTLEELIVALIIKQRGKPPRLRIVQRLDKETSGLVVFARTVAAERGLGRQFKAHTVERRYLAIVPGYVEPQTITSQLVRDRGDGRRGSSSLPGAGKKAVTHVDVVEKLKGYTLLACRLETGRTHQIRIHLAELGHPVCGEKVYNRRPGGSPQPDHSGAPRLALHAAELGFLHPVSEKPLHWAMPLPPDLQSFLDGLRGRGKSRLPSGTFGPGPARQAGPTKKERTRRADQVD
jgi:23S rRNA pseudouridine1911/1915/1917 synthase